MLFGKYWREKLNRKHKSKKKECILLTNKATRLSVGRTHNISTSSWAELVSFRTENFFREFQCDWFLSQLLNLVRFSFSLGWFWEALSYV